MADKNRDKRSRARPSSRPSDRYVSALAWNPTRPDTVIISCVDGRWRQHIQDFAIRHLGAGPNSDFMAVPGGVEPLNVRDMYPNDFQFFRQRLEALVGAHGTQRIVLVAHQDCAWYQFRFDGRHLVVRDRQIQDLHRSREHLREMFPSITVETIYARLEDGTPPKVVFEPA